VRWRYSVLQKTRCLEEISFRAKEKRRIGIKEKGNVHMTLLCNSLGTPVSE
jgi:hypothetical protein